MKGRFATMLLCVGLGILALACVPQATDEELNSMCDNLVQLRGEISSPAVETLVGNISVKFDKESEKLEARLQSEKRALNEEMKTRLAGAKTDNEKADIKKEFESKVDELTTNYEPGIKAIKTKKSEAVEGAKKEAEESRAAWNTAVQECVQQAKKEGTTQKVAHCRIKAETTDKYWNGCR